MYNNGYDANGTHQGANSTGASNINIANNIISGTAYGSYVEITLNKPGASVNPVVQVQGSGWVYNSGLGQAMPCKFDVVGGYDGASATVTGVKLLSAVNNLTSATTMRLYGIKNS